MQPLKKQTPLIRALVDFAKLDALHQTAVDVIVAAAAGGGVLPRLLVLVHAYCVVELLYLAKELFYALVLRLQLLLHLLELTLLIDAPDDLVDVQLEAHVAHLVVLQDDLRGRLNVPYRGVACLLCRVWGRKEQCELLCLLPHLVWTLNLLGVALKTCFFPLGCSPCSYYGRSLLSILDIDP